MFLPHFISRFFVPAAFAAAMLAPASVRAQTPAAPPQGPTQSLTIVLRFIKASDLLAGLLPLPEADLTRNSYAPMQGLFRVSPDDTKSRVFVQGTPEAVSRLQKLAELLDVEAKPLQIRVRILRGPADARIRGSTQLNEGIVVTSTWGVGKNNEKLLLQAIGEGELFRIAVTPRIHPDNSLTLSADLSRIANTDLENTKSPSGMTRSSLQTSKETVQWTRRIASGGRIIVASVASTRDAGTAYYLEITPRLLVPAAPVSDNDDAPVKNTDIAPNAKEKL